MTDSETGRVPCRVGVNYTIWERYGDRLARLQEACPHVPIGGRDGGTSPRAVEHKWRDEWGCLWHFPGMGLDGVVVDHPLASWDRMDRWAPPSATERVEAIRRQAAKKEPGARVEQAGTEHGFIFLRLTYLRGFENFMVDVASDDPRLYELRDRVADYWHAVIQAHLDCGATHLGAADDLGLQDRLPISPAAWRKIGRASWRERG